MYVSYSFILILMDSSDCMNIHSFIDGSGRVRAAFIPIHSFEARGLMCLRYFSLTLGGGYGWLSGEHVLAIDRVIQASSLRLDLLCYV